MSLAPFPEVLTISVRRDDDAPGRWLAVGMADGVVVFTHRIESQASAYACVGASLQSLAFSYMRQAAIACGLEIPELDLFRDDGEERDNT